MKNKLRFYVPLIVFLIGSIIIIAIFIYIYKYDPCDLPLNDLPTDMLRTCLFK